MFISQTPLVFTLYIVLSGREVTKIDFGAANLTFSGLKAIDYFGDGSFYFVNTPGVSVFHLQRSFS